MALNKLTEKQDKFALALFSGDSQRTAYRKAFPTSRKWKDKSVDEAASKLASDAKVISRLSELRGKAEEKATFTLDNLLEEIAKIAFASEADFYNDDGTPKQLSELTPHQKAALKSYTIKSVHIGDGVYEDVPIFQFHDKIKAIDMAMKNKGGYEKDNKREFAGTVITMLPQRDKDK